MDNYAHTILLQLSIISLTTVMLLCLCIGAMALLSILRYRRLQKANPTPTAVAMTFPKRYIDRIITDERPIETDIQLPQDASMLGRIVNEQVVIMIQPDANTRDLDPQPEGKGSIQRIITHLQDVASDQTTSKAG